MSAGRIPTLAKHVRRPFTIRMTYKGKLYKAQVRRDGTIYHRGKTYASPSAAASAVTGGHIDGWRAWKYLRIPAAGFHWTNCDDSSSLWMIRNDMSEFWIDSHAVQ